MRKLTPIERSGRWWVPNNRWDLVVDEVASAPPPDRVALVVPYFEQPASLERMYEALGHAVAGGSDWELIVVDDGSSAPPPPPPPSLPIPVRVLRQDDRGCRPGAARNLGAAATDAEVLVFFDADTLPEPATALALARWPATLPDALVVGRRHHADLDGWSAADVGDWLEGRRPPPDRGTDPAWLDAGYATTEHLLHVDDRSYRFVISAVMACSHGLYDDIGGFDHERDEYGGDDWEFAYRAFNNGAVLVHLPDAVAWHDEPDFADRDGRAEVRQAQSSWLARVVPEPSSRCTGVIHDATDVIADVHFPSSTPFSTSIASITSLIAAVPDVAVHLGPQPHEQVVDHFAADPRVRRGPATLLASRRARHRLVIDHPVLWSGPGLRRLLDCMQPGASGRVDVDDDDRTVARITSTRATGRARRSPANVTLPDLFGTARYHLRDLDAVALTADVDLAAWYGGWLDLDAVRGR